MTYRDGIVILQGEVDLENGSTVEVNPTPGRKTSLRALGTAVRRKPAKRSGTKAKKPEHPLPGFGAWKHRSDIQDTAEFSRQLRKRVSRRATRR